MVAPKSEQSLWFSSDKIEEKKLFDLFDFRLTDLRRAQDLNRGLSFPAISASGSNAAVIHYQPQESTVKGINTEDIYLCE